MNDKFSPFCSLLSAFMLIWSMVFLSTGCSNDDGKSCNAEKDCPITQRCESQRCMDRVQCTKANHSMTCRPNETCLHGFCIKKDINESAQKCLTDLDCEMGVHCNRSIRECVECLDDDDCQVPQKCNDVNQCVPDREIGPEDEPPEDCLFIECVSDEDCQKEEVCDPKGKICRSRVLQACNFDKECPKEQYCSRGYCSFGRRRCGANLGSCQEGDVCRKGVCSPLTCHDDRNCKSEQTCDPTDEDCHGKIKDCKVEGCPEDQRCDEISKECERATNDCIQDGCPLSESCNQKTKKCEGLPSEDCTIKGCDRGNEQCNVSTKRCEKKKQNVCQTDQDCVPPSGTCLQGICLSCATQFSCKLGTNCNVSLGICEEKSCLNSVDCPSPYGTCYQGKCKSCSEIGCSQGKKCNTSDGKCIQPPCLNHGDCPLEQQCSNGGCVLGMRSCRSSYSCGDPKLYCKAQQCIEKQCGLDSGKKCSLAYVCKAYECKEPVRKSCGGLFRSCSSGDTCLSLNGKKECYTPCVSGGQCNPGFDCLEIERQNGRKASYCFFLPLRKTNDFCGTLDSRCIKGNVCLFESGAAEKGVCHLECQKDPTLCRQNQICSFVDEGISACLPIGKTKKGEKCLLTHQRCDETLSCYFNHIEASIGRCIETCSSPGDRSNCGQKESCVSVSEENTKHGVCFEIRPAGESCSGPLGARCENGVTCTLLSSGALKGTCLKNCSTDNDCVSGTGDASFSNCVSLQSGGNICYR